VNVFFASLFTKHSSDFNIATLSFRKLKVLELTAIFIPSLAGGELKLCQLMHGFVKQGMSIDWFSWKGHYYLRCRQGCSKFRRSATVARSLPAPVSYLRGVTSLFCSPGMEDTKHSNFGSASRSHHPGDRECEHNFPPGLDYNSGLKGDWHWQCAGSTLVWVSVPVSQRGSWV